MLELETGNPLLSEDGGQFLLEGEEGGLAETLSTTGDLTTDLDIWLDSQTLTGTLDKVAVARAALMAHYPLVTTTDFTTLLALFLNRVAPEEE